MDPRSKHFRKRDAILAYLRQTDQHPSAETVYANLKTQIPDLSLGTVYRNLSLFKQQGLIVSLGSVDGVERYDGEYVQRMSLGFDTRCILGTITAVLRRDGVVEGGTGAVKMKNEK